MKYFPLFYNMRNQRALLVGGGAIATRKARLLVKAGAVLRVVSPDLSSELSELVAASQGEWIEGYYHVKHLADCCLVISATDNAEVNRQVSSDAKARFLPVNVVDSPELCSYITPAIVERDEITIAISSGGSAPVLARLLRKKIETAIPGAYGRLAKLASQFKKKARAILTDEDQRRRFWEDALEGPAAELALNNQMPKAEQRLSNELEQAGTQVDQPLQGEVYLVGAGPGDPDLLTLKALRLMQQAEVVLYDRLVTPPIMDLVRRDAERIYVGKRRSEHTMQQTDINKLLLELAQQGKRVLRLKGGDPFIFGRGGEEIDLLAKHHIPFQVVPGITAASGCAAYSGIPLTHRECSQSVRFVTGHLQNDRTNLQWPELADSQQTLVFYMGLAGLTDICNALIKYGKNPNTPAALIEKGTTPEQRVLVGDLTSLPNIIVDKKVEAPTLLIVGEVVTLRNELSWFGH